MELPQEGKIIEVKNGKLRVPNEPIIAYIEGDGIGREVIPSALKVADKATEVAYSGKRKIIWWELLAGKKALKERGELLPQETIEGIALTKVAIKGPLETPVGSGHRSLNVTLRKVLDLYANVRPVKYYGAPTPFAYAEHVDFIIFRENTEDVYAGIEWKAFSEEAKKVMKFLEEEFGIKVREDSGLSLKPISKFATQRIMRKALQWAIDKKRKSVTIMHKGNIMKFTEGAFREWCYEVAEKEFGDYISIGEEKPGKILVNDRIADNMFQQIILKPWAYDIIVTPNLNGDYISDAAAALVGGVGMAAGLNLGDHIALAEPVHGTAPDIAGKGIANPSAAILSVALLLEYIGWEEAADLIRKAVRKTIESGKVTADLAKDKQKALSTEEFTNEVIKAIEGDE
ncbi:NADP-dependent isocitrate dehydrogenase [Pyrococcus sp. ST04]|uniref:NADP-dependent isocitrate dehydrogenase n=1 Tax=Pyrococcus sp. ST04 TaxID=1183377 RepID=UPI0002605A16|nr:NADP-dependent isocitrate dehydrogenase [Pyrococcus sp. ST04]AFK21959.1 isocitrate dehydrogenase [Pyrococcus sp. ST04]